MKKRHEIYSKFKNKDITNDEYLLYSFYNIHTRQTYILFIVEHRKQDRGKHCVGQNESMHRKDGNCAK